MAGCTGLNRRAAVAALVALVLCSVVGARAQADPLPSWNDGAAKQAITDFVARVTTQSGADFVPPAERIATFDNDGTLWTEQPLYFQLAFAFDRVKAMAPEHPDWKTRQPFKALLEKDTKALAARERAVANPGGHACRHDHGGVCAVRPRLARDGKASAVQPSL